MNIIKPSAKIWDQEPGLEGIYKQIEKCGRICYASEPIEGKAEEFVNKLIRRGHTSVLEHGTVYLQFPYKTREYVPIYDRDEYVADKYKNNEYSRVNSLFDTWFITTNYRVLVENDWLQDLKYLCEKTSHHYDRITAHFTTQIAVTREFNRHRVNSMSEQSTRYCNYGSDKFGNEINVNIPTWIQSDLDPTAHNWCKEQYSETFREMCSIIGSANEHSTIWRPLDYWLFANYASEFSYLNMIHMGVPPQNARTVLPLDTNSELVHTAFVDDWVHFFDLRVLGTTGAPHPDAKIVAEPLMEELKNRRYIIKDNMKELVTNYINEFNTLQEKIIQARNTLCDCDESILEASRKIVDLDGKYVKIDTGEHFLYMNVTEQEGRADSIEISGPGLIVRKADNNISFRNVLVHIIWLTNLEDTTIYSELGKIKTITKEEYYILYNTYETHK